MSLLLFFSTFPTAARYTAVPGIRCPAWGSGGGGDDDGYTTIIAKVTVPDRHCLRKVFLFFFCRAAVILYLRRAVSYPLGVATRAVNETMSAIKGNYWKTSPLYEATRLILCLLKNIPRIILGSVLS